jgi:hypothetical protein
MIGCWCPRISGHACRIEIGNMAKLSRVNAEYRILPGCLPSNPMKESRPVASIPVVSHATYPPLVRYAVVVLSAILCCTFTVATVSLGREKDRGDAATTRCDTASPVSPGLIRRLHNRYAMHNSVCTPLLLKACSTKAKSSSLRVLTCRHNVFLNPRR